MNGLILGDNGSARFGYTQYCRKNYLERSVMEFADPKLSHPTEEREARLSVLSPVNRTEAEEDCSVAALFKKNKKTFYSV